jgi:hypothetical protein
MPSNKLVDNSKRSPKSLLIFAPLPPKGGVNALSLTGFRLNSLN